MDIRTLANQFYAIGPDLAGGSQKERLETFSREEFIRMMEQARQQRVDKTEIPCAGNTQTREFSGSEIAGLDNNSDPQSVDREVVERDWERYGTVFSVLRRMEAMGPDKTGEDDERADLIRQLADPDSDFYSEILEALRQKMEEREDQEREQAIIDALGLVLDAMSGKRDTNRADIPLSTAEIARRISELDPQDPERVRLELFLQRFNELGIYFDPADLTGGREEGTFETLTELLMRRQREQIPTSGTE